MLTLGFDVGLNQLLHALKCRFLELTLTFTNLAVGHWFSFAVTLEADRLTRNLLNNNLWLLRGTAMHLLLLQLKPFRLFDMRQTLVKWMLVHCVICLLLLDLPLQLIDHTHHHLVHLRLAL